MARLISRKLLLVLAAVLAVASLFVALSALGKPFVLPWQPIELNAPALVSYGDEGGVVVDSSRQRLLFMNGDAEVTGIIRLDSGETPITEAVGVSQRGNTIYVSGICRAQDAENVVNEAIVAYDCNGKSLGVVWEDDALSFTFVDYPTVIDVEPTESELQVVRVTSRGYGDDVLTLYSVPLDGSEETEFGERTVADPAYDATYMEQYDSLYVATYEGDLLRIDSQNESTTLLSRDEGLYCSVDNLGDALLVYDNKLGTYTKLELTSTGDIASTQVVQEDALSSSLVATGAYMSSTLDGNTVHIANDQSGEVREFRSLELQTGYRLRMISVIASVAYLALAALVLVVVAAVRVVRSGHSEKIGKVLGITMFVTLLVVAVSYFSRESYNDAMNTRTNEVLTHANYLYMTPNAELSNAANRVAERIYGKREPDEDADYYFVCGDLDALILSGEDNSIGLYYNLYATDGAGDVRYISSNRRDNLYGAKITDSETAALVDEVAKSATEYDDGVVSSIEVRRGDNQNSTTTYTMVPLHTDDNECRVVLELGSRMESFEFKQARTAFERILTFVVLAAAIYIGMFEFSEQTKGILRYRELRAVGDEGAGAALSRTYALVIRTASKVDRALAVIVAKDILEATGGEEGMFLIGLPPLVQTLGVLLGRIVFTIIGTRHRGRPLLFTAAGIAVIALLSCFVSATQQLFWPFIAGKLVSGIAIGVMLGSEETHPEMATSREDKSMANQYFRANAASSMFAGLLGGAVAAVWGTPAIYIASAVLVIMSCRVLWHALPKDRICLGHVKRSGTRESIRGVLSPQMLPYFVLGGIPCALASGYGSLIFPLFMSSSGVSDASISALSSLGTAVSGLLGPSIGRLQHVIDRRLIIFLSLLGLSFTFAPFAFNQTVVWAVVSIVVLSVLNEFLYDWFWYQYTALIRLGYRGAEVQPWLEIESNVCNTIQPIILGVLMTTGTLNTCLLLAVYFFVDALGFGVFIRRQMRRE